MADRSWLRTRFLLVAALAVPLALAACSAPYAPGAWDYAEARRTEKLVRDRLASLVDSVSVTPMEFSGVTDDAWDNYSGYKVTYRLRGCPVGASNFTMTGYDFVSQTMLPATGTLSPQRFRDLMLAYGRQTSSPLGAIGRLSEHSGNVIQRQGPKVPRRLMWAIIPGYETLAEIRPRPKVLPGYVFFVPPVGAIQYLGRTKNLDLWTYDYGD